MALQRVVGLTGSIGSGKTQVAEFFAEFGAHIIDADVLARQAVAPGSKALAKIVEHFGPEILSHEGQLERGRLASIVFNDPVKRKALEEIVHPEVRRLFRAELDQLRSLGPESPTLIVYVVPLLFETNYDYCELDKVIVVSAAAEICLSRIVRRDGSSAELAKRKLASQLPIEQKEALADLVIKNEGALAELKERALETYQLMIA